MTKMSNRVARTAVGCLVAGCFAAQAQTGPAVVSAGYLPPSVNLAPGALITLYATGVDLQGGSFEAASLPLPLQLGGISVVISTGFGAPLSVPLLSVAAVPGQPQLVAVTVQVPHEIFTGIAGGPYVGSATIYLDNTAGPAIPVTFVDANVHLLQRCAPVITDSPFLGLQSCSLTAQHSDGSPISANSPARAGETIVFYAVGMGNTEPAAPDGYAAAVASPVGLPVSVALDFAANAAPLPGPGIPTADAPAYAGSTPGYVGLYQVNIELPSSFPIGTMECSGTAGIATNLTITVEVAGSVDGGGVCVAP